MQDVTGICELDLEAISPHNKIEGPDWIAVFNPSAPPNTRNRMKVELSHNLNHDSVVSSVRFSLDGKLLATGCNRLSRIYVVETGILIW